MRPPGSLPSAEGCQVPPQGLGVGAGLTSSWAEMVEAGMLGTLPREGLRACPGEPSESPSPATSWISWARMATSFTSVWLNLQPPGERADPVGTSQLGPGAGRSWSQVGLDVPPPQADRQGLPGGSQ